MTQVTQPDLYAWMDEVPCSHIAELGATCIACGLPTCVICGSTADQSDEGESYCPKHRPVGSHASK